MADYQIALLFGGRRLPVTTGAPVAFDDNEDRDPENRTARWEMWALLAVLLIHGVAVAASGADRFSI